MNHDFKLSRVVGLEGVVAKDEETKNGGINGEGTKGECI